jgi:serine/threonine-protein kinase
LGVYADGRPYYAMRFIRGDSLQEAIERFHRPTEAGAAKVDSRARLLELRQLLGRFIDVCNAVEYAHSRGVLHRDLKPSNVMLGHYGETLVVDWGLAKAQGRATSENFPGETALHPSSASGSMPTMMGSAIGTPQYMSPEQAEGQLDQLGPATDVYSLGATLYCLLTGSAPFSDSDVGVVLRKVRAGDFPPPRAVNRDVSRGLEAICLKAMARSVDERYSSPRELAADIEHWLADEAVTALPESPLARLARWSRRHRAWTRAASVAMLLVTIVSMAAGMLIDRSRRGEAAARQEAERQRIQAEEGFLAARGAVDDFFTDVSETKLLDAPGLQPLRKELLATALAYYQDFIRQRAHDPTVQSELAATFYRVGQIENSIGTKERALSALRQAQAIQRRLAESPGAAAARFALSDTYNAIAAAQLERGDLPGALGDFEAARNLRAELVRENPEEPQYLRKLANSHNNVAVVQAHLGNRAAAIAEYQRANEARAELDRAHPGVTQFRRDLAQGYYNLGLFHLQNDEAEEALASYRRALGAFEALVELDDKSIAFRRELLLTQCAIAEAEATLERTGAALASFEAARQTAEAMVRANPLLLELRAAQGRVYLGLGRLKRSAGIHTEAVAWLEKSRAVHEQLLAEEPSTSRYLEGVTTTLDELARVERERGQPARAADLLLERRKLSEGSAAELYRAASQLALTVAAIDLGDFELSDADRELRHSLIQQTLESLRAALSAGYKDLAALRQDPDFESVREHPDFKRLVDGETEEAAR